MNNRKVPVVCKLIYHHLKSVVIKVGHTAPGGIFLGSLWSNWADGQYKEKDITEKIMNRRR